MGKQKIKPDEPKSSGNIYDRFAKKMFGRIMVFADFLTQYADPKFVAEIDLRKIVSAPTHYLGKDGAERIVDLVFQCPLKNGTGTMTTVIIFEHQSGSLKRIPRKLLKYISAIWDAEEKEGKKPSSPYFIVLRTGKKPHRGRYPQLTDSLPKGRDGLPIGKVIEIDYDVVDLPACDFCKLSGGPVLRLAMGMLKKMAEGLEEEFPEVLLPLTEIKDEDQQIELTKELLDFVARVMAAHNKRLDATMIDKALKPIFRDRERTMIKTIFDEKVDEGIAIGEARADAKALMAKAETVLTVLRARFDKLPKTVEQSLRKVNDLTAMDSWAALAATCKSLSEFEKSLR